MGADAVLGQLDEAIDKLQDFPGWLSDRINAVLDKINSILSAVPGWAANLVDEIIEKAKWLLQKIQDLSTQLLNWLTENVWPVIRGPVTLWEAGNMWTSTAYKKVTQVSGQLNLSKTNVEDYWQGPAATAYMQVVPAQKAAADKIAEAVSTTRETIQDLTYTLAALYIGLVAGLLAAAIQIAGGSAAVASVLGIPPGLMAIITGLLTAIGTVGTIYAAGKELVAGSAEKFAKLLELKNDGSAFDKGHWPKATKELADASITDKDRSNWSYKR